MSLFHSPGLTLSRHAWELPVQQARDQADTKAAPTTTTVGQVLRFLQTERPGNLGMLLSLTVDCENARYVFSGELENLCVLRAGIELQKVGVDPFAARWFSYDSDWSRDGDRSYLFFVVQNDTIVHERLPLFGSELVPSLFEKPQHGDDIWHAQGHWREAEAAYWYRKFYTDTRTGQLMALRPDEPRLFYFDEYEARVAAPTLLAILAQQVTELRRIIIYSLFGGLVLAIVLLIAAKW